MLVGAERAESVRQRDACEGTQCRLLGALGACQVGALGAGPKVRAQGGLSEIVEQPVEVARDRALDLAACEQPPCHEGWMPLDGGSCA